MKILDRLDWLAHLVLLLVLFLGILVAFYPSLLPKVNIFWYASIPAMVYLIPRGISRLVSAKTVRTGAAFLRFSLLYLSVIVSFASIYYLIGEDFVVRQAVGADEDASIQDMVLQELIAKWETLTREIPEEDARVRVEYDKWKQLESKITEYKMAIALTRLGRQEEGKPPQFSQFKIFEAIKSLNEGIEKLRAQQKELDWGKISKHKDRLAAQKRAQNAREEITRYSYLSFVYFSTVTAATVGYGDITPKRLRAKMVVVVQILLGGALVLIYLTLALTKP